MHDGVEEAFIYWVYSLREMMLTVGVVPAGLEWELVLVPFALLECCRCVLRRNGREGLLLKINNGDDRLVLVMVRTAKDR